MADDGPLEQALRDLRRAWDATADGWRDRARDDYGRLHHEPIEIRTREAARTLGALATLVEEAKRQCR